MKNKTLSFLVFFITLGLCLNACKEKSHDSDIRKKDTEEPILELENTSEPEIKLEDAIPTEFKSTLRPNKNLELGKIYKDTVNYVDFNDVDYDDRLFSVEKNKATTILIYNTDLKTQLVEGDNIEITWKIDSLRPAGDPDYLDFKEHLVNYDVISPFKLKDKNVKTLWRETQYDEALKAEVNTMVLNENYINSISAPEKAALAYVATFIGNECEWDGKVNDSRSNLRCKILTALDLDYQCSDTHYGFLKKWLSKDANVLKTLETCTTIPNTATKQSTFNEILIQTNAQNQTIIIRYKVNVHNMREASVIGYTKIDTFQYNLGDLTLIDSEKIDNQPSEITTEETKNTFVVSCGSGCAMTYTEREIISNVDTNQVTFKVVLQVNEIKDDEYFATYVFNCNIEIEEKQIQLIGNDGDENIEDLHSELKKQLMTYKNRFCN
jgi:hypothetical protein